MTVRQECLMEHAIDPSGGSGGQWDAWEAMFSPRDPATGRPRPMFDARSGAIDRAVVEAWSRFDIARLVTGDWERFGPILRGRVRLACGAQDSFYLNRAVERLREKAAQLPGAACYDDAQPPCRLKALFQEVDETVRATLASVTLATLAG